MTGLGDLCLAPIGRLTCVRTRSSRSFCSALRSIRLSKYANESCTDGVSGIALELGQNLAGGREHTFVQPAGISSAYLQGLHILCDNSAAVGSRSFGVNLSTSPGRTWDSCWVISCSDRPDF